MLSLGWMALGRFEQALLDQTRADLTARADFLDQQLGAEIPASFDDFAALCRRFGRASDVRIMLLSPRGSVECDSSDRPEELDNLLARAEIRDAISGKTREEIRYNAALDHRVIYLAAPVTRNDQVFGVLYFPLRSRSSIRPGGTCSPDSRPWASRWEGWRFRWRGARRGQSRSRWSRRAKSPSV